MEIHYLFTVLDQVRQKWGRCSGEKWTITILWRIWHWQSERYKSQVIIENSFSKSFVSDFMTVKVVKTCCLTSHHVFNLNVSPYQNNKCFAVHQGHRNFRWSGSRLLVINKLNCENKFCSCKIVNTITRTCTVNW